jgi:hypothetical protein
MLNQKIYLLIKVNVVRSLLNEFNEYWEKESLPNWIQHGAKHVGSFANLVGGPTNEIIRLFEFEDISHWEKYMEWRGGSKEGQESLKGLIRFIISLEERLLTSIY